MTDLLSDAWWKWLFANYSYSIALLVALLKAWAVCNPNVPSDKIIDLFKFRK